MENHDARTPPNLQILATDNGGNTREIAAIWATSKPEVFGGKLDFEDAGYVINFTMVRADRPKAKPQPSTGQKPAAQIDRMLIAAAYWILRIPQALVANGPKATRSYSSSRA